METFSEKELPIGKEERIKLALAFIREQYGNKEHTASFDKDNQPNPNELKLAKTEKKRKSTIRQIALYFQIPKSTLYDRMKADQGQKRQRTVVNRSRVIPPATESKQYTDVDDELQAIQLVERQDPAKVYAHTSQMKFSPEEESAIVHDIQRYMLAYGNLPLISNLKDCISNATSAVPLGNKWISSFIRRHAEESIYGNTDNRVANAKFKDFKQWKNRFGRLYDVFLLQFQLKMKKCSQFQYICRYTPNGPGTVSTKMMIIALDVKVRQSEVHSENEVQISWLCEPRIAELNLPATNETNELFLQHFTSILELVDVNTTDLVILEGFTPTEHWDWSQCLQIVEQHNLKGKLFTVPWGNRLLSESLKNNLKLNDALANNLQDIQTPTAGVGTPLIDLAVVSDVLKEIISTPSSLPLTHTNDSVAQKEAIRQLMQSISDNESRLYREIQDPASRVTLCNIFNQVRSIDKSMST
ncbi:unnamed protein product [Kluyveromyces dobzhanskii CBS 2104]|uniref:WGS project CCBQ000000000 data, contig 00011 n=1 Tax=Kluyveromyces dobzhanskii CBS 2104 TaxID=1427455 RepID=A0A0A8LA71_9SACH|nr:unnamed protein product [Kluyveromyces dobzhanskii CBS 2104]